MPEELKIAKVQDYELKKLEINLNIKLNKITKLLEEPKKSENMLDVITKIIKLMKDNNITLEDLQCNGAE